MDRDLMFKLIDCALSPKNIQTLFKSEVLSQLETLYSAYFGNHYTPKQVNEEFEGLGSVKQMLHPLITKVS